MWQLVIHIKSTYFVKRCNTMKYENKWTRYIKTHKKKIQIQSLKTVSTHMIYVHTTMKLVKLSNWGKHWNTKDQTCHTLKHKKNKQIIFSPWHGIHQQAIHKSCLRHSQWGRILCSSDPSMPWACSKRSNNSPTPNFKPMLQRLSRTNPPHLKSEVRWGGSNLLRLTNGTGAGSNLSF